jgi:hypothetical protein
VPGWDISFFFFQDNSLGSSLGSKEKEVAHLSMSNLLYSFPIYGGDEGT